MQEDKFELFISSTEINYCYYRESHRVLGNTFGMLVLQDFEAVTPNVLARTVETVEGGGIVVLLLKSMDSLQQLYTMSMDAHARFRTEAHADVVPRFNERFILSLAGCSSCLVLDDELNVLPISSHARAIAPLAPEGDEDAPSTLAASSAFSDSKELKQLKESLKDTQPIGSIIAKVRTVDQVQRSASANSTARAYAPEHCKRWPREAWA
jgi:N-acetyltransferase 10